MIKKAIAIIMVPFIMRGNFRRQPQNCPKLPRIRICKWEMFIAKKVILGTSTRSKSCFFLPHYTKELDRKWNILKISSSSLQLTSVYHPFSLWLRITSVFYFILVNYSVVSFGVYWQVTLLWHSAFYKHSNDIYTPSFYVTNREVFL